MTLAEVDAIAALVIIACLIGGPALAWAFWRGVGVLAKRAPQTEDELRRQRLARDYPVPDGKRFTVLPKGRIR